MGTVKMVLLDREKMQEIELAGTKFFVIERITKNKNASARLKDKQIIISIPARWPNSEKQKIKDKLQKRAIRAIEKGKWRINKVKKTRFYHGQKVKVLENEFEIIFISGERFDSRIKEDKIELLLPEHPEKEKIASLLVRKEITEKFFDSIEARVNQLNSIHFQATIGKLSLRDNFSRWGSCSRKGSISLNFKLLFMPQEIMDYVIIHELAHTKYRNHGPRFWSLVEKAMPDYSQKRKWLRENGDRIFTIEDTKKSINL